MNLFHRKDMSDTDTIRHWLATGDSVTESDYEEIPEPQPVLATVTTLPVTEPGIPTFVVLDVETTGLIAGYHEVLEIAACILDSDLNTISRFHRIRNFVPPDNWERIHPVVRNMHKENGLWEVCRSSTIGPYTMGNDLVEWLNEYIPQDDEEWPVYLTGNSIEFDREHLRALRTDFDDFFHYRLVNISSFKIVHGFWCEGHEGLTTPQNRKIHRAIPDCEDSISELQFYREHFFTPSTGNRSGGFDRVGFTAGPGGSQDSIGGDFPQSVS